MERNDELHKLIWKWFVDQGFDGNEAYDLANLSGYGVFNADGSSRTIKIAAE